MTQDSDHIADQDADDNMDQRQAMGDVYKSITVEKTRRNPRSLVGVDCPKITEDKSSESRVQTSGARLIIATSAAPRLEG